MNLELVGVALAIVAATFVSLAVGGAVARYGAPLARLDLERLYMYIVASAACLITAMSASGGVIFAATLWFGTGSLDELFTRSQLAMDIGLVAVCLPAWLLLQRVARRLSLERRAVTMHRAFLYLVALTGIVGAVTSGGVLLAQGVRLVMGLADLNNPMAVRELQATVSQGTVNAALFGILWWAYLRAARRWPGQVGT